MALAVKRPQCHIKNTYMDTKHILLVAKGTASEILAGEAEVQINTELIA